MHDLLGPRLTRVRSAEGRRPHVGLTFAHDLVRASRMRCAGRMAHQAAADAEAELPAAGAAGHRQPRAGACRCPLWHLPERAHTADSSPQQPPQPRVSRDAESSCTIVVVHLTWQAAARLLMARVARASQSPAWRRARNPALLYTLTPARAQCDLCGRLLARRPPENDTRAEAVHRRAWGVVGGPGNPAPLNVTAMATAAENLASLMGQMQASLAELADKAARHANDTDRGLGMWAPARQRPRGAEA